MGTIRKKLKQNKAIRRLYGIGLDKFCCFLTDISPELNSRVRYKDFFGRKLDLENPKTLNEKLMWIKLNNYNKNPLIYRCADKWAVRAYIEEQGYPELLNEVIAVYDDPDEIEWDKLPSKFALKWSFGSGMNIICYDKSQLDIHQTVRQLKTWKKNRVWRRFSELQYKFSSKKLIVEKFIDSLNTDLPIDYKVFCFHGEPKFISEYIRDKETFSVIRNYFDFDWNVISCVDPKAVDDPSLFEKPEHLDEIFDYAKKLSKPFPFVRMDFYQTGGKVMFGEMTFTPTACLCQQYSEPGDLEFGKYIDINKVEKL